MATPTKRSIHAMEKESLPNTIATTSKLLNPALAEAAAIFDARVGPAEWSTGWLVELDMPGPEDAPAAAIPIRQDQMRRAKWSDSFFRKVRIRVRMPSE